MRYIGNKTKLLTFIGDCLSEIGVTSGRALDAFAGTASVGSYLKSIGYSVAACDIMSFSYVFQRAYIVVDAYPDFSGLDDDEAFLEVKQSIALKQEVEARFEGQEDLFGPPASQVGALEEVLVYLDSFLEDDTGFISRNYSAPEGETDGARMYFTRKNAQRIDAIRRKLHEWEAAGLVTEDEFYVVLAALLEAADSVANTTGVYAAYVKSWQNNALKPLRLALPSLVLDTGRTCEAHQADINCIIGDLGHFDLLYLDPPYNTRQYIGYYHVPEIIAEGWFDEVPEIRGKTGLIPDDEKKSAWSTRDRCVAALENLLESADADHVLMSYNNEGIIPEAEIERVFRAAGISDSYRRVGRQYARYRSDADSESRQYKGDQTTEYLYYVRTTKE